MRAAAIALSVLAAASPSTAHAEAEARPLGVPARPNIVLLTVDTLRADHVGAYGYARSTTPAIDEMSRNGVRFVNALSQAPWTLPSLASIHTGLYPTEHGATDSHARVSDDIATVAEALRDAGYLTIGVVAHDFAGRSHGLAQGFEIFDESTVAIAHEQTTSRQLVEIALEHVKHASDRPFFLWVHFFDPHFNWVRHPEHPFADAYVDKLVPGTPTERVTVDFLGNKGRKPANRRFMTAEFKDFVRAVYDEEIAGTDEWIGRLVGGVAEVSRGSGTVTLLTADHGEFFWERGQMFHEGEVYRELVHVPLIITGSIDPKFRSHLVFREVELASLARTIAELAGVGDHGFHGENLASLPARAEEPRLAFSEGNYAHVPGGRTRAAVYRGWKLIQRVDTGSYELYDTSRDPLEARDLWQSREPEVTEMKTLLIDALERFAAERHAVAPRAEVQLDAPELERLKALGYVE